ncbi:MAG: hypothetical protein ACRDKS_06000, partial [Actinomycetota bacterium]
AENLAVGVDDPPGTLDVSRFGREGLHDEKPLVSGLECYRLGVLGSTRSSRAPDPEFRAKTTTA